MNAEARLDRLASLQHRREEWFNEHREMDTDVNLGLGEFTL